MVNRAEITAITGIQRLEGTSSKSGQGDNWHTTWASNGKQYTSLCDGTGWDDIAGYDGAYYNHRLYAINGDAPDHTFEHLPEYPICGNMGLHYGFALLARDNYLYHFLGQREDVHKGSWLGAKLIYSDDYGRTWYSQDGTTPVYWESKEERNSHNMVFWREPNNSFSLLTALQMGKNYEHNTDGYIYVYAPNGDGVETMRQLVMFRVPKEPKTAILERTNYEYFVALRSDGTADWSGDIDDRGAVYTFPGGWVNTSPTPYAWHPSVVYDAPLRVYVMVTWGNGCSPNGVYFDRPSYLGFWIAEHPWGPWRQIHEEVSWMPEGDPALPRLRAGSMNLLRDTGRRKKCCRLVSSELSWTVAMMVTRYSPRLRIMTATSSIWRAS